MLQRENGEVISFFANCTSDDPGRHGIAGHSAVGWMEFKRSEDFGESWGPSTVLDYSKNAIDAKTGTSIFTEKAIATRSGTIVLFHLICDISEDALWEPYLEPTSTRSVDGGLTWSDPVLVGNGRGRIYDALYAEHKMYCLKFKNNAVDDFCGTTSHHVYELYMSEDEGKSFILVGRLPFDTQGRGYGNLCRLGDGRLIAYVYNKNNEHVLDYSISRDFGKSWTSPEAAFFAKRIRNPQVIRYGDCYFIHGRSGSYGPEEGRGHFVLYFSGDGLHWDKGTILARRQHGQGAYSNSIIVNSANAGERVRMHASHAYNADSTNTVAWWIDEKTL
jgi:hypothetical protein